MPENKNTLLPCPFCRASLVSNDLGPWWVHQHNGCFLVGKVSLRKQDIKAWNTRTPTLSAPQTGYSWTNSAPQGAPETTGEQMKALDKAAEQAAEQAEAKKLRIQRNIEITENSRAIKLMTPEDMEFNLHVPQGGAPKTIWAWDDTPKNGIGLLEGGWDNMGGTSDFELTPYTLKATSDARIAALQAERDEDANQLDSSRHTVDVLTARIAELEAVNRQLAAKGLLMLDELATARNEALEEVVRLVNWRIHESKGQEIADRFINLQSDIRALKTPEEDE